LLDFDGSGVDDRAVAVSAARAATIAAIALPGHVLATADAGGQQAHRRRQAHQLPHGIRTFRVNDSESPSQSKEGNNAISIDAARDFS